MNNSENQESIIYNIKEYPELIEWFRNKYLPDIQYILDQINDYLHEIPEYSDFNIGLDPFIDYCTENSVVFLEPEEEESEKEEEDIHINKDYYYSDDDEVDE